MTEINSRLGPADDSVGTVSWRGERIAIGRGACVSFFDSRAPTLVCKTPIGRTDNHKDDVTQVMRTSKQKE